MSLLNILKFPDSRLRTVAKPVDNITGATKKLIEDMFETMYEAEGIGLAATQVNVHKRIIVIDVDKNDKNPIILINPVLEILDDSISPTEEGCLSVPEFTEIVNRPQKIRVTALDKRGKSFDFEPRGLLAVCVQHEIDHLNGKLFVDYLSPLKRTRLKKKLEKKLRYDDL
jgi:peptide deformylase